MRQMERAEATTGAVGQNDQAGPWADLAVDGGRRRVTLERTFPTSADDLWAAITQPDRAGRWLGSLSVIGDEVRVGFDGGVERTGRVVECDRPRRIELLFDEGRPDESRLVAVLHQPSPSVSTRLVLTEDGLPPVRAALFTAGWHHHADRLAGLTGADDPATPFGELVGRYRVAEARAVRGEFVEGPPGWWSIRHERVIGAAPEQVWDAVTSPARLGRWLWPVVEWPDDPVRQRALRTGDHLVLGDDNVAGGLQQMDVLELDPGRRVVLSWEDATVTLSLSASAAGTLLVLEQSATADRFGAGRMRSGPDYAAGWHSILDALQVECLNGVLPDGDAQWKAAYALYRREGDPE